MNDGPRGPESRSGIDMELLAAYIDGALPADERASVERLLASSAEARELLAEAVRLQEDLGEGEEVEPHSPASDEPSVVPIQSARSRSRWLVPTLAAAAVVAVSLVPWMRGGSDGVPGLTDAARLIQGGAGVLGEGWDAHSWTVTRSEGVTLSMERSAFRTGVRWTDALVAWQAGDSERASTQMAAIGVLLDGVPLGAPAARVVEELRRAAADGNSPEQAKALLRDGQERLSVLLPPEYLDLGRQLESLRLAAQSGDVEFIRDRAAEFSSVDENSLSSETSANLREVREILRRGATSDDLPGLITALDRLTAQLGG